MGKNKKPIIGYRHYMTLYMGESYTNDYLAAIEIGGETAFEGEFAGTGEIAINRPSLFGGDKKEGGVVGTLSVRQGAPDQLPHPLLQTLVPGPWPAARGLCTTVFDGQVGAMNPYVKLWRKRWGGFNAGWTTPNWLPGLCRIGRGKNPMHMLYQAFTDTTRGLGLSTTLIGDSFAACAQQLYDEQFGLCLPYRRSEPIGDWIQIICDHVGGAWAEDPRTGKIEFHLFRTGYDVDALPLIDESMIMAIDAWDQPLVHNTVNQVTVVGFDPVARKDISATYQNLANIQSQGRVVAEKRQFPGLWNRELVARIAQRETAIASGLLARIKLVLKADMWGIKRGDVRALSVARKGWGRVPVRVLEVDEGTRTETEIRIVVSQDIDGMPLASYIAPVDSGWTPPDDTPKPLPAQRVYEATRRDLAASMSPADLDQVAPESGYLVGLGADPGGVAYGFDLVARTGAAAFEDVASSEFTPTGVLASAIGRDAGTMVLDDASGLARVAAGDEWVCNGEHGRVLAVDAGTATIQIARGCVDTVPAGHFAGDRVWFSDVAAGDPTEYLVGEEVDAKLLCRTRRGLYDAALADPLTVEMAARQVRPYPPARLRVGGSAEPTSIDGQFNVTWRHRDRLLQGDALIDTDAASVGPEPTTRYALRFEDAGGGLLIEREDIDGAAAAVVLAYTGIVRMQLWSISDLGESWQRHERTFAYTPPAGATESSITAPTWTPTITVIDGGEVT